jgi:cysteine desulfurase/selenocysteine lyase
VSALVRRCAEGLSRIAGLKLIGEPERLAQGALVAFYSEHPEFSTHDLNLFLNHELDGLFVAVRAGEHCAHLIHRSYNLPATVRASFFAYNSESEVDAFIDAVALYAREACS